MDFLYNNNNNTLVNQVIMLVNIPKHTLQRRPGSDLPSALVTAKVKMATHRYVWNLAATSTGLD